MRRGTFSVLFAFVIAAVAFIAPLVSNGATSQGVAVAGGHSGTLSPNVIVRPIWD